MEGYLLKWTNIIYRWKPYYFILHNDVLIYCEKKGGPKRGAIYLKISSITQQLDYPLRIYINTGTSEIILRAQSIEEKIKWQNKLKEAQEKNYSNDQSIPELEQQVQSNNQIGQLGKKIILDTNLDKINEYLAEIWVQQAHLDEALSILSPKLDSNPQLSEYAEKLEKCAHYLKKNVTLIVQEIEEERKRIYRAANYLSEEMPSQNNNNNQGITQSLYINNQNNDFDNYQFINKQYKSQIQEEQIIQNTFKEEIQEELNDETETEFKSFIGDDQYIRRPTNSIVNADIITISDQPQLGLNMKSEYQAVLNQLKYKSPIIYKLITQNDIFKRTTIDTEPRRYKLPAQKNPNEKLKIWSLIKDSIGKDLSKFAVPVYLNEPLSMLQRMAEQMIFSSALDNANNVEDNCLKIGYVMGFGISINSFQNDRKKKPFNPLLGETHEYIDPVSGAKMVSEQVSHHPPISALYAENDHFRFWNNSNIKTSFWGKCLEIKPLGINTVILKKGNLKITFNKPITCVQNIIFGNMYIDNYGEMKFTNHTTGESGILTLTERTWNGKGAFEVNGCIKDNQGVEQYKVKGRWDSHLVAYNIKTNKETLLWKFDMKFPPNHEYYYYFSEYTINLNYLNVDLLTKIPQTDSRLRPDQRALEYGLPEQANNEKKRLEDKQRVQRKENQAKNIEHVPKWFEEKVDKDTGEKEFIYKGGYWETREKGEFTNLLDIY